MRRSILVLLVVSTSGCFPAIYMQHAGGRVVDKGGRPVANATLLFTVYKLCGSVGGGSRESLREVIGKTSEDGTFSMTEVGPSLMYFVGIGGCLGFSNSLQICRNGRWSEGYYDKTGHRTAAIDGSGAFVYMSPRENAEDHDGDYARMAQARCESIPRESEEPLAPEPSPPVENAIGKSGLSVAFATAGSKTRITALEDSKTLYSVELPGDVRLRKISDTGAFVALSEVAASSNHRMLLLNRKGEIVRIEGYTAPIKDFHFSPSDKWLIYTVGSYLTYVLDLRKMQGGAFTSPFSGWEVDDEGDLKAWVNEGKMGEWARVEGRKVWKPAREVLQRRYRRISGDRGDLQLGKDKKLDETRIWNAGL